MGESIKEFSDEKVVVGGDGLCNSPGFTAKNLLLLKGQCQNISRISNQFPKIEFWFMCMFKNYISFVHHLI